MGVIKWILICPPWPCGLHAWGHNSITLSRAARSPRRPPQQQQQVKEEDLVRGRHRHRRWRRPRDQNRLWSRNLGSLLVKFGVIGLYIFRRAPSTNRVVRWQSSFFPFCWLSPLGKVWCFPQLVVRGKPALRSPSPISLPFVPSGVSFLHVSHCFVMWTERRESEHFLRRRLD